jgi:hypothetical protein
MTSFRNIVIGTNLFFFGFGVLLILIFPTDSGFSILGKMLVIAGIPANLLLAFSISTGPVGRVGM